MIVHSSRDGDDTIACGRELASDRKAEALLPPLTRTLRILAHQFAGGIHLRDGTNDRYRNLVLRQIFAAVQQDIASERGHARIGPGDVGILL